MKNQITLAEVTYKIIDFFKTHGEVATVVFGDESVFEGSTDTLYPLAYIEADTSTMGTGEDVYSLSISVWDRPMDDRSDLLNIQSKTRMILSDLRVEFVRNEDAYILAEDTFDLTPLKHVKNDRVVGWLVTVSFDAKGFADRCRIPKQ